MRLHGFILLIIACLLPEQNVSGSLYGDKKFIRQLKDNDKDGVINIRDKCKNTPLNAKVDNKGCHKTIPHKLYVELKVFFETDSTEIRFQYYKEIKKLADFMKDNPSSKVVIEGHTDNSGRQSYNQSLSYNRAQAIADILIQSFKISAKRVKAIGYSESRPIASNASAEGKKKNRRVVAEISIQTKIDINRWDIYSVDDPQ